MLDSSLYKSNGSTHLILYLKEGMAIVFEDIQVYWAVAQTYREDKFTVDATDFQEGEPNATAESFDSAS